MLEINLPHMDWKQMHRPGINLYLGQEAESGEARVTPPCSDSLFLKLRNAYLSEKNIKIPVIRKYPQSCKGSIQIKGTTINLIVDYSPVRKKNQLNLNPKKNIKLYDGESQMGKRRVGVSYKVEGKDFTIYLNDSFKNEKQLKLWQGRLEEWLKGRYIRGNNPLDFMELRVESSGRDKPNVGKYGCVRDNRKYSCNNIKGKKPHYGWDLKAKIGTNVYSSVKGIANFIENIPGYGKSISIRGEIKNLKTGIGDSVFVFYAHLQSINIKDGQEVNVGDIIGKSGVSGNAIDFKRSENEQHLHIEILTIEWPRKDAKFKIRKPPENYFKLTNQ